MPPRREIPDPLLIVHTLSDGDARQVASARGFTCQNHSSFEHTSAFCTRLNADPVYLRIDALIEDDELTGTELIPRPHTIMLGELVLLWGKPATISYCEQLVLWWSVARFTVVAAVPRTNTVNYLAPVLSLSFFQAAAPNRELPLLGNVLHGCRWD